MQFLLSRTPTAPPGKFATSMQFPFDKLQELLTHRGVSVVMSLPFWVLRSLDNQPVGAAGRRGSSTHRPHVFVLPGYLKDKTKYTALPRFVR